MKMTLGKPRDTIGNNVEKIKNTDQQKHIFNFSLAISNNVEIYVGNMCNNITKLETNPMLWNSNAGHIQCLDDGPNQCMLQQSTLDVITYSKYQCWNWPNCRNNINMLEMMFLKTENMFVDNNDFVMFLFFDICFLMFNIFVQ